MPSCEVFSVEPRAWEREESGNFEQAEIVEFERIGTVFWRETRPQPHPPVIEIIANTRALAETDMPFTDRAWPIVSIRMLEALLRVGPFQHEAVPVHFRSRRSEDPDIPNSYVVLRHWTHLDVFDREKSEFKWSKVDPQHARSIRRLVLRCPPDGFPSAFRIPEATGYLFVSGEARRALEEIGVRGIDFVPVEVI